MTQSTETKSPLVLAPDQKLTVVQGGVTVHFNAAGGVEVAHGGQNFLFTDIPAETNGNKPIDGAPGLILHHLNETDIGQMIETDNVQKGILLAPAFQHLNREGKHIGPVVDYFAAPKDTRFLDGSKQLSTYNRDIQRIADLEDVCGHRGILLRNDAAIYDAAENDPAKLALWHMPTLPLVNGRNIGSDQVNPNNMYAHKNKGVLQGTFTDKAGSGYARWYWSATEHRGYPSTVYGVDFSDGDDDWDPKDFTALSSRPVRAVIRPDV